MIRRKIEGYPMWLDLHDHGISKRLYIDGGREFAFMWILRREAEGVAFDVGANIGYCTLSLARRCEKVLALEPDPRSRKLLKKNVKLNKIHNTIISGCAMSDVNHTAHIALALKPNLTSFCDCKSPVGTRPVECISMASAIKMAGAPPSFIKMDIEGGEVTVLRGAREVMAKLSRVKLLIEAHPGKYGPNNDFAAELRYLVALGYRFKYVVNAKGKICEFEKRGYKPVKTFKKYPLRAVFAGVPEDEVISWATTMPDDGKKVIRSFLLCRE